MKISKKTLLILALLIFLPKSTALAYSEAFEEKFIGLDTSRNERVLDAAESYINTGQISPQKKEKLTVLVANGRQIIKKIDNIKDSFRDNIRIRKDIRENLTNRSSYFSVKVDKISTNKDISELFTQVAKEDPYFYYSQYASCKINTSFNPSKSSNGKTYIENANFDVSYRADMHLEYNLKDFVKEWVRENIAPDLTDYAKVVKIHDFIVKKNNYNKGDKNAISGGFSIYHPSSIIYGNGGVCNAYASLFDLMAKEAGLETIFLTGKSKRNGEDHMWNMVKVLGVWYHIDTTWDDPVIKFDLGDVENIEDFVIYDYFLKSDTDIKNSRTIDEFKNRPKAESNFASIPNNSKIEEHEGKFWVIN